MSYRTFVDDNGEEWQVWDVFPSTDVRRTLVGGWLTFQSEREKRRLAPVPLYWVSAGDDELCRLLASAKPAAERTGARAEMPDDTPLDIPPPV
jgi:hypothetical protein